VFGWLVIRFECCSDWIGPLCLGLCKDKGSSLRSGIISWPILRPRCHRTSWRHQRDSRLLYGPGSYHFVFHVLPFLACFSLLCTAVRRCTAYVLTTLMSIHVAFNTTRYQSIVTSRSLVLCPHPLGSHGGYRPYSKVNSQLPFNPYPLHRGSKLWGMAGYDIVVSPENQFGT
jgi:hypothetical protein